MTPHTVDTAAPSIGAPLRRWLPMLICGIGYFALAALGIWLARLPGSVATLWLPNAFCLGLLLHRPRAEAPWLLASMVGGNLAANGLFVDGLIATTVMALGGFGVAVVVGVALAVLMARSALFEELVYPFLNVIRVMPTVAIAPLLIIWFGRNAIPIIICSFLIAVFPILVDVAHGLMSVDEDLVSVMKLANASELSILLQVRIPNALPYLFSSFRVAAPGAVVGALLGEYIGSREGLGYLITVYSAQLNTAAVFVLALLSCLVGIVFFNVCVWLERVVVPWKTVVR